MTHHPIITFTVELCSLSFFAVIHGTLAVSNAISESDWSKLTGPHAAIFVLAVFALGMVWKARKDDQERIKEGEAKERRHSEMLVASERHFETLIQMNRENAQSLIEVTVAGNTAISENSTALKDLKTALTAKPLCNAHLPISGQ